MSLVTFARRVAVVSGGAGGIGSAVAARLAGLGAGVLIGDVDLPAAEKVAGEINDSGGAGRAVGARLDVTRPQDWAAAVLLARRRFGIPDVLVNNAGVLGLDGLEQQSDEDWSRVVDVTQRGTWLGIKTLAPIMRVHGGGAIVNVSSVFARVGSHGAFAYHAAKGAVDAMTRAAALELAPMNIRVNAVLPGLVDTAMSDTLPDEFVTAFVERTPFRRMARPAEIADAVAFLASEASTFITGADLVVDGGYTIQ